MVDKTYQEQLQSQTVCGSTLTIRTHEVKDGEWIEDEDGNRFYQSVYKRIKDER